MMTHPITEPHIQLFHELTPEDTIWDIYVPSYSRAGTAPFLNLMRDAPVTIQQKIHIAVRQEEYPQYRAAYPGEHFRYMTVTRPGVAAARLACLQDARRSSLRRIIMADDDIMHIHPLRRVTLPSGKRHSQRYSKRYSGIEEPLQSCQGLSLASIMADAIMQRDGSVTYGALRNDLFSGDVDTSLAAVINSGPFPSCVFFIDVERFSLDSFPPEYQFHGEDLAMFLFNQSMQKKAFVIQNIAYDQSYTIPSTIDLDATSGEGRKADMDAAEIYYPEIAKFLRVALKNQDGGVKRIGINWRKFYAHTGLPPEKIYMDAILNLMKERNCQ